MLTKKNNYELHFIATKGSNFWTFHQGSSDFKSRLNPNLSEVLNVH